MSGFEKSTVDTEALCPSPGLSMPVKRKSVYPFQVYALKIKMLIIPEDNEKIKINLNVGTSNVETVDV